jgi:SAM-dependent methyltransferase
MSKRKNNKEKQIISTQRVVDHGEVFTSTREVNAMLDLVKDETERIDSRFLEPACGTGNFLAEVLTRKLNIVESRYKKNQLEYERYALVAVCSLYGIDILEDSIKECRNRLLVIFQERYKLLYGKSSKKECIKSIDFVLKKNIIRGNALDLKTIGEHPQPIVFSEWSPVNGSMIKRRDFEFHELLSAAQSNELPLFSDLGEDVFIPEPIKEYPLTHFLRLADAE